MFKARSRFPKDTRNTDLGDRLANAEARALAAERTLAVIRASTSWRLMTVLQQVAARVGLGTRSPAPLPQLQPAALPDADAFDISILAADDPASSEAGLFPYGALRDGVERVVVHGHNVNQAAQQARGRALLVLDPGVRLRDGTLQAALAALDSQPDIGAVGGRVVLPDGTVQEAGRIIWATGANTGYGRGLPEAAGPVMARRDVDACSGGFLLIRRSVFAALGGFDPAFPRGSTADSDLCLRLRSAGHRVVYEPKSVVDAPLQRTATPDEQKLFRVRHLDAVPPGRPPTDEVFARDAAARKRLLVIDGFVPLQVMGAGYPRAQALLNAADALGWSVTLFTLDLGSPGWANTYAELSPGIEVISQRGAAGLAEFLRARPGFYDVVLISRPETMQAVRAVLEAEPGGLSGSWPGARLVYDAEALFTTRRIRQAVLAGAPLSAADEAAMLARELALTQGVDAVAAVTPGEAAIFRTGQPAPVTVLSHPVQPRTGPDFAARSGFLFVGRLLEKEAPNYDGLHWFIQSVWPAMRAALGDAQLTVVGALHADPAELCGPGVRLFGPVNDLKPAFDAARVFIAPARFAAGVPIKVLEAGEAGLPVLTTSLIAAQLGWTPGHEVAAADEPAALAALGVKLHEDAAFWHITRTRAAERLRREHGAELFQNRLHALLEDYGSSSGTHQAGALGASPP